MEPPGVNHGRRVRQYTSLCGDEFNRQTLELLQTDPLLQIIVATVALANGVHAPELEDAVSLAIPDTVSELIQGLGRAGRLEGSVGRTTAFVPKSDFTRAEKGPLASVARASHGRRKKKNDEETMDPGKRNLLLETVCYIASLNRTFQNPPLDVSTLDCRQANRQLYCSLCRERYKTTPFSSFNVPIHPPFLDPPAKLAPVKPNPRQSLRPRKERPLVQPIFIAFGTRVMENQMFEPENEYRPEATYFPAALITALLDNLLKLYTQDSLDILLDAHDWPFRESHGHDLWNTFLDQQMRILELRKKATKGGKKKTTKRMEWDESSEEDLLSEDDPEEDNEDDMDLDVASTKAAT
ncbi:hypothetical protein BDZ89DRAFT_1180513 [Hymenopellis radicata]|nr:hypothetical protein BDZ89DRAFT_1180513 [Hymenopellis radicata]